MKKSILSLLVTIITLTQGTISFSQSAGSLDPSFGTGGKVVTNITSQDKSYAVEIQTDGKIVVVGYSTSGVTGKDFTMVRYNANGSLDNGFGTAGIVTTDLQLGSDDVAYDVAIQLDGKIVLAGYSDDGADREAALVRYNGDGTIDNTFGVNGISLTDFDSNQQDEIKVVKIHQLTGNIIVGGSSVISTNISKPVIARYLANGTLDVSFETNGIRLLWITPLDYQYLFSVEDLVVQSNGKISAVGWRDFPGLSWDSDYWAGRVNSDGTMDATFSTDGVSVYNGGFNGHDKAHSMFLKANNNYMMAGGGYVSTLHYDQTLFELNADGTSSGWAAAGDYGTLIDDIAYSVNEDVNGQYVLSGSTGTDLARTFAITRVNTNGSLDATFGGTGMVTTSFNSNAMSECFDALVQSDNKIVAVGYTGSDFALARYVGDDTPMLDGFVLQTPADVAVNQNYSNLVFNWTDAFGATSYEIDVDVNAAFTSAQTYVTSASTKTVTDLLENTQYFWRVRASDGGTWGQYSSTWSFTTNSLENFALVSPTDNAVNQEFLNLNFDWSAAVGASSYEIEYDVSQTFSTSPQSFTTSNTDYIISVLNDDTQYFWRVRASDGTNWGQWSTIWKFTTKIDDVSLDELGALSFELYPNPTAGDLKIDLGAVYSGTNVKVFNSLGQVVINKSFGTTDEIEIFIEGTPGMYILEISTEDGKTGRFNVIKE